MAVIRIDGGCTKLSNGMYEYIVADSAGVHHYFFSATQTPKLGDKIDTASGTLVPNTAPIINNDPGFQAKRKNSDTWPHGTVDIGKKEEF